MAKLKSSYDAHKYIYENHGEGSLPCSGTGFDKIIKIKPIDDLRVLWYEVNDNENKG